MGMEKEEIKTAVKEALAESLGDFYIERETHYLHHQFVGELIQWSNKIKGTIFGTLAKMIVIAIVGLIILGFIFWGQHHFK